MTEQFAAASTTDDVLQGVNLRGKRVFITGVSSGLGLETARAMVAHGAQVIGTVRDPAEAERANMEIRSHAANGGELMLANLDLSSLASARLLQGAGDGAIQDEFTAPPLQFEVGAKPEV